MPLRSQGTFGRAMTNPQSDPATVRISVRAQPDEDLGSAVRGFYGHSAAGRAFLRHGFEPAPDRPLSIDGAMRSYRGLGLGSVAFSAARTERNREALHDDDLWLSAILSGRRAVKHCGREIEVTDGEAFLMTGSQTATTVNSDTRFISFRVPFKPVAALVPDVEDLLCRTIPRDVAPLRLLASYGQFLMSDAQVCPTVAMQQAVATHVYDLIALTLGAGRDAAEAARSRGAGAARLRAIKADIEASLDQADLSAATIAARHRLPLRYLQRLFEIDGVPCTQFILDRRLARAHRMLTDPRLAERPVSAIAFDAGFSHLSRFNRAFRARFGATPSDVRVQAQRGS
jgi:AraC-like DNA-binding protein